MEPQLSFGWDRAAAVHRSQNEPRTIETRRDRGIALFRSGAVDVVKADRVWNVASQSMAGARYTVRRLLGVTSCNCLDYQESRDACKHVLAVLEFQRNGGPPNELVPLTPLRKTTQRDWSLYNRSKLEVREKAALLLSDLVHAIADPVPQRGNQHAPPSDLLFASVMRIYDRESGRDFCGALQEQWRSQGFLRQCYHFNTLSAFMRSEDIEPVLHWIIRETARPLTQLGGTRSIAMDSSGFATCSSSVWFDERYGRSRKRAFMKLHIAADTRTHVVTAAIVTDDRGADSKQFESLLMATAERYRPDEVSADKAYAGLPNYNATERIGATPYIPPRERMTGKGSRLMEKMFHGFRAGDPEVLHRYHLRSNIETVMAMIKLQFGDALLSRSRQGQVNELLGKVICHNLDALIMAASRFGLDLHLWNSR